MRKVAAAATVKFSIVHARNSSRDSQANLIVWAQLFEGRLALNPGLNLTWMSFSFVKAHFVGSFSLLFLKLPIVNL